MSGEDGGSGENDLSFFATSAPRPSGPYHFRVFHLVNSIFKKENAPEQGPLTPPCLPLRPLRPASFPPTSRSTENPFRDDPLTTRLPIPAGKVQTISVRKMTFVSWTLVALLSPRSVGTLFALKLEEKYYSSKGLLDECSWSSSTPFPPVHMFFQFPLRFFFPLRR